MEAEESDAPPPEAEWRPKYNPWLTAVVATLATFMEVLDTTIVNVSLPHIAGNLGAEVEDSTFILTSYLVSNAIVLPISAWLSSLMGRRNFYLCCITAFTVASFLCGTASSLGMLVFFRLIQGLAGGGLQPTTQAILVDTFPPRQRGMSMAIFGMTIIVAPIIGPTLGGWITDNFSWRWIFFINIPVGIGAVALCARLIEDPPYFKRREGKDKYRVDFVGLGLIALGIGAFQMMLDLGERMDWFASNFILICSVTAVVSITLAVIWELRHKDPIVNLRLLGERNFGLSVVVMLLFGAALYTSTALLPLYMQTLMNYSATASGLAISPGGMVVMVMMPFVGYMAGRFDARVMIAFGVIVISYSLFRMSNFNPLVGFGTIVWARVIQSFGLGFFFVPVNTLAYAYVGKTDRGSASGLINLARNSGASFGIAITSSLITRRSQIHQNYLVESITPQHEQSTELLRGLTTGFTQRFGDPVHAALMAKDVVYQMVQQQARALAFEDVFRYVAPAMLLVAPLVMLMKRPPKDDGPPSGTPGH